MKRLLIIMACVLIANAAGATEPNSEAKGKGVIKGTVTDESSSVPIEYATVSIMKPDSQLVTGAITDSLGRFMFLDLTDGAYIVKTDFIGFASVYSNVEVTKEQRLVDLGTVQLTPAGLDEFEVVAERAEFRVEIDRKVYDPSKNPVNSGGTGLDVMRNVPSVEVDADDNISLRGDQSVNILVDGRPIAMSVAQFLKQVPASMIDEIEVITNPSAKYDPEGMSGIINVKLKKNRNKGFNGSLNAAYGHGVYNKYSGGISVNYMTDKINLTGSVNGWHGYSGFGGSMERNIFGDTVSTLSSIDRGRRNNYVPTASLGLDYFVNDRNTLYLSTSGGYTYNEGYRTIEYDFLENDDLMMTSTRIGQLTVNRWNTEVNGGWQKKFEDDGHTFDLDIRGSASGASATEKLDEAYFDPEGVFTAHGPEQIVTNDNDIELLNVRADYVRPLGDSTKLETGIHYTGTVIRQGIFSESYNPATGDFTPDTAINNDFSYSQGVLAGYAILGRQFKKWGVKAGLRAEQTNTLSELITTNETFVNNYFELFPSAHISLGANPTKQWQLSYSRRINRPSTQEVNPFTTYDDPYTLQRGNPFLRPEFIHVFEASHLMMKDNFTFNGTGYYRKIIDQKRRYLSMLDGGIAQVSYDNLASTDRVGAELIFGYRPMKMIRTNLTVNYWYSWVHDPSLDASNTPVISGGNANLNIMARLKQGYTLQFVANYRSRMNVIQGVVLPAGGLNIALSKQIFDKRGSLVLRVNDVFKTRSFNFVGDAIDGYDFTSNRVWESRNVWLTFNYSFGKTMRGKRRRQLEDKTSSDNNGVTTM